MRACVVLVCLSACGRYGFLPLGGEGGPDDASGGDAVDMAVPDVPADACALGAWSAPTELTPLGSMIDDFDMALHPNQNLIVFSRRGAADFDLFMASYSTTTFGTPVAITSLNTTSDDLAPTWNADGTELYFTSDRSSAIYEAHRASFDGTTFGAATPVTELAGMDFRGAHITADNLELWFTQVGAGYNIFRSTRTSATLAWSAPVAVNDVASPQSDGFVTLSADKLEIYFDSTRQTPRRIWRATRATVQDTFGTASEQTLINAGVFTTDPDLSRDGRTLLFASTRSGGDSDIFRVTRGCL